MAKDHTDGNLIFRSSDGMPFKDEKAATIQQTRLLNKDKVKTKVVAVEGGFALKKMFEKRPKRIPLGKRNVLTFPDIPGYKLRVVNDKKEDMGQRIRDFENAGWQVVRSNEILGDNYAGRASSESDVVKRPVGGDTVGVLMKKKQEWFKEDQQEKQKKVDEAEERLVAGASVEGRYGKIKIGDKPY